MKFKLTGSYKTAEALRARLDELHLDVTLDDKLEGARGPLGQGIEWAEGRTASNRFAIHPMEGWDATTEGTPSELTLRRWRRFGLSGASLIWGGEAFAVQADGRANKNQLYLSDEDTALRSLEALRAEVLAGREEIGMAADAGPIGLQLTHSGRWSRPLGPPAPQPATRDALLDERAGADVELLTDEELQAIRDRYVIAAKVAKRAGFDFVDVKACHGYLLHELLGAHGRPGPYGGAPFENRTRLFVEIIEAIRAEVPGLEIGVRVSLADVVPHRPSSHDDRRGEAAADTWAHGFGVDHDHADQFAMDEPFQFLKLVQSLGVRMINVTLGSPYYNPHLQRPAAYPPSDGYQPFADPLVFVADHLEIVRKAKAAFPELLFVGTGYTYLMDWLPHVAQAEVRAGHVDFVGLGRMVLSYPDLPRDVLEGREFQRKLVCRTFSDCTTAPRNGLKSGCYPLDALYKAMPERAELETLKTAKKKTQQAAAESPS
ncbi:MAG: 2,4-dienoyl-CoA reductase-like NADH-dependent reductase (Old Yellow Enzyme family) [Planctomycetota bacterium]|jgi:2,4-dienoyl-CoA reductase-like NADH-dependent reductase (Old Yellow Enzyme family)